MAGEKLYLVDGMSHIFRAYYALPPLKNSKGMPTNAIYGFVTMVRKLIAEEKPFYLGVALDLEGPTVRHATFEKYKANRKVMPDDLAIQLPYIWKVCDILRIPRLSYPQYEADDVIGTLARKAVAAGLDCIIVTNDKDMCQLVSDKIFILDSKNSHLIDAEKVEEKMGVRPNQVVDLLGLWGDASDNVPGAPGIGEKGAKELIQKFGTIENCLQHYEEVSRKTYRESLKNYADQIRMCRELVTIHCDLPIELDLESLTLSPPDHQAAQELFLELGFTSLLKEYMPTATQYVPSSDYQEITTEAGLSELMRLAQTTRRVGLCIVPDPALRDPIEAPPIGIAISPEPGKGYVINFSDKLRSMDFVSRVFSAQEFKTTLFDVKRERRLLEKLGIAVPPTFDDVMLIAYLLDPNSGNYRLSHLSLQHLGRSVPELEKKGDRWEPSALLASCCERASAINALAAKLGPKLQEQGLDQIYSAIELPLAGVLSAMELAGVKIDVSALGTMSQELELEINQLTKRIYNLAGLEFNINSSRQLGEVLFVKHQLPSWKRTQKTKTLSTDSEALEQLAANYELPKLILEYRQLSKLKSTYVDSLPKLVNSRTGRIHTSYNQTGAATGRLSSSDPNFQNIPVRTEPGRKMRSAIIAEEGNMLLSADYSQIELRIMAHLSEDKVLVEAFQNAEDIHTHTAIEVFGMGAKFDISEYRRRAKVINFGIIYGQSAFGLSRELKTSRTESQKFIDNYFLRYEGVKRWLAMTLESARKTGHVKTLFGRVRPIPEINSNDRNLRGFAERAAINSPIQGTAADLIKMAMIRIHQRLKDGQLKAQLILQVHDELVFEVPEKEVAEVSGIVKHEMENVYPLNVPLLVDIHVAKNWRDLK